MKMKLTFVSALIVSLLSASLSFAQQRQQSLPGVLKAVDAEKGTVTITADGKDTEYTIVERTRIVDNAMQPIPERLKDARFTPGIAVQYQPREQNGKMLLSGLKLGSGPAAGGRPGGAKAKGKTQEPAKVDMSQVKPLSDMSPGESYKGYQGGLYPDGSNERPANHTAAGLALANQIQPLGPDGRPAADGKIALLCVGMSNTTMEFSAFMNIAGADKEISPNVVLVDGAQGGQTAFKTQDPKDGSTGTKYWEVIDSRIKRAGVTPQQVQAVWFKQADAYPTDPFPKHAETFLNEIRRIMQNVHTMYPNLKIVYLSSRTYGGYAKTGLNPEPFAYEEGLSVKWLIEEQIKGNAALNYDSSRGAVKAPWLSWGPYLWTRGMDKRGDGMMFAEEDFRENDRTHPSASGQEKVARMLLAFLKSDTTSRGWFTRSANTAKP